MTLASPPQRPEISSAPLEWRTIPTAGVEEALALWRDVELRHGAGAVAASSTWVQTWLETYGDVVPVRFVTALRQGQPRGIALLVNSSHERVGPFRLRTCHIGTAGEPQPGGVCVEYNRLLAAPEDKSAFVAGLCRVVQQDRSWDQFRLDGFSESDLQPWLTDLPGAEVRSRDSKYFDLEGARAAGGDILARLGGNTRSNLRRRLKKYGELDVEWATSVDQAADILEELVLLHQQRWQAIGLPGAFASPRFLAFQRKLCVRLFVEQRVVLFRVRHQGETVGCLLLLVDQNRLLDYLSGLASFESKPSPGLVTHYLCMNAALERGFTAYDFLVGDKQHKDNLSDSVNQLHWLTWSRPRLKLKAIDLLRRLKRSAQAKPDATSSQESAE